MELEAVVNAIGEMCKRLNLLMVHTRTAYA